MRKYSIWVINSGSMSSLNIKPSEIFDTHVAVYTFSSAITSSLYSSTCSLYLGNLIMSPTWQISLVVLSIKLKAALGHLYVMLTVQGINSMSDLYPDPIIVVSIITYVSLHLPSSYSLLWSIGGSISFLIIVWFLISTS